jgi:hypothetical protein
MEFKHKLRGLMVKLDDPSSSEIKKANLPGQQVLIGLGWMSRIAQIYMFCKDSHSYGS